MNETKNFLLSKTFQGILVMILGVLLPRLGLDFGDAELSGMAADLAVAAGTIWAVVGRITAKKNLALGRGGAAMILLCLVLPLAACAVKAISEAPPHDQARFYADQVARTYLDISEGYRAAWPSLTPEEQAWCSEHLKPVLKKFKTTADALLSAAKAWTIAVEDSDTAEAQAALDNCDAARRRYEDLAAEAASIMASAHELYAQITEE